MEQQSKRSIYLYLKDRPLSSDMPDSPQRSVSDK